MFVWNKLRAGQINYLEELVSNNESFYTFVWEKQTEFAVVKKLQKQKMQYKI